jgi:enamine deaminase RidA (YjgF/YER057c/UK114 family)
MEPQRDTLVPDGLAPAVGFSHGIATRGGRIVWLAGQNGTDAEGRIIAPGDLVAQTDQTLANLIAVVEAAGGAAGDIVKLHLWVRDVAAYRAGRRELGRVWRKHFGRYYPAMMLLGVTGFYDEEAEIEIDGYAVVADAPAAEPAPPDSAAPADHEGSDGATA